MKQATLKAVLRRLLLVLCAAIGLATSATLAWIAVAVAASCGPMGASLAAGRFGANQLDAPGVAQARSARSPGQGTRGREEWRQLPTAADVICDCK